MDRQGAVLHFGVELGQKNKMKLNIEIARNSNINSEKLSQNIKDDLDNLEDACWNYICKNRTSAYKSALIHIRKLLLGQKEVNSYIKSEKNKTGRKSLFELAFGNGKNIYISPFPSIEKNNADDFKSVDFPCYMEKHGLISSNAIFDMELSSSKKYDEMISLRNWLKEPIIYDKNGSRKNVRTCLTDFANKHGAHSENWKNDWRSGERICSSREKISPENENFEKYMNVEVGLEHFSIACGLKLLFSCVKTGKNFERISLFDHPFYNTNEESNPRIATLQIK